MKVLLINPPNRYQDKSRTQVFFPVGLGYIAGALKDAGHEVEILDIYALNLSDEEVVRIIRGKVFDVVGIGAMSTQYKYVKWLASVIKGFNRDKKIILGWVLATHSARVVLANTDVDICVVGEGENTVKELLSKDLQLSSVKGIAYKDNGKIQLSPSRGYIKDLENLPKIPYEIFPMQLYIDSLLGCGINEDLKTINVSCGRGCPYECTFCSKSFSGIRLRPIKDIIAEISYLQKEYGVERIFFSDELVVTGKERIMDLCRQIAPLKIKWSCQGRVNLVDEDILRRMKESGCTAIGYGVESASQKILDSMNKRIDIQKAEEVIKLTKRLGLTPYLQFIFGYPGEDIETITELIEFYKRIDEPQAQFSPLTPLPGTSIWDDCVNKGIISDEADFLEKLEGGYMPDSPVLVNFTSFAPEELNGLRIWSENQIRLNYIKRHPLSVLGLLRNKLKKDGFCNTYNKIHEFIERNKVCTKKH